jgi:hypothetical protein
VNFGKIPPERPISPAEARQLKAHVLPDFVFRAFNACILKHFDGKVATFDQDEVIKQIQDEWRRTGAATIDEAGCGDRLTSREAIFENKYLDVELAYEQLGWKVLYDKPAYNESYAAYFTFHAKNERPT